MPSTAPAIITRTSQTKLDELKTENRYLSTRLKNTRTLKLKYEEKILALETQLKAAHRACAGRIQEVEKYAAMCQRQYEKLLEMMQSLVERSYNGQVAVKHYCPECNRNRAIYHFGVRVASNSKNIVFSPHCLDCEKQRGDRIKNVMMIPVSEVADNFTRNHPQIAERIVFSFMEEAEAMAS